MFYRLTTDGLKQPIDLRGLWAGPERTTCWIIGGGPSLRSLPVAEIAQSPAPKFAINLAGHGLLRPDFWTSYDPTDRFLRSIYLDASITKFVHRCRAMDLIPESTYKVCDAPALFCFDRAPQRGFHNVLSNPLGAPLDVTAHSPTTDAQPSGVTDWQDSLIQAIAIAYHLGFRRLCLAGCEMLIRPAHKHLELAASVGVEYRSGEPLNGFFDRCRRHGLPNERLSEIPLSNQYHFDETKSFAAAVQTDDHYFRVAQYLRLSRRSFSLSGLELVSVTPESRLNDYFPYSSASDVMDAIRREIGDPTAECTPGRYTGVSAPSTRPFGPMRDYPPHNWRRKSHVPTTPEPAPTKSANTSPRQRLQKALEELPEIQVPLNG